MLIRYYGPVGIPSGYGHAANETCMAILAAGLDLDILTYHPSPGVQQNFLHKRYADLVPCVRDAPLRSPDVVIVHTLPADCARVLEAGQIRALYPGAHCIAYTTWECWSQPRAAILSSLMAFDEVWVPSQETRIAFVGDGIHPWRWEPGRRVRVLPHAYDDTIPIDPPFQSHDGVYRFYNIGAWTRRKNPEGVIQAFLRAFPDGDEPVRLRMQSAGAPDNAALLATVAAIGRADLRIGLSTSRVTDEEVSRLHSTSDCFVTASRGESWNLPAFDAMLHGCHIITPYDLGSREYLGGGSTSATMISSYVVPAGGAAHIAFGMPNNLIQAIGTDVTVHDDWMEPDLHELAKEMRWCFEHRPRLDVNYNPAARYGRRAIGALIKRLLQGRE